MGGRDLEIALIKEEASGDGGGRKSPKQIKPSFLRAFAR